MMGKWFALTRAGLGFTLAANSVQLADAADGGIAVTAPMDCQLIGQWRIVDADIWGRDYLDLVEPAMMVIRSDGRGEIAFGAMQAGLDLDYGHSMVTFTWFGFDEMDQVSGSGSAELQDDGSLEIELDYHLGDDTTLRAERVSPSTAR
jgi:hypothetical protein